MYPITVTHTNIKQIIFCTKNCIYLPYHDIVRIL